MAHRLQMTGIRKSFGATLALDGVSIDVEPGTVHALVGENGAGKSTLMKVLSGALSPDEGSMQLDGEPYTPRNPQQARAAGVAMIYQELSLAPHLSVTENVFLGVERRLKGGVLDLKGMRETTCEVMERVGLTGVSPDAKVSHLSSAQCQQVEVVRAVASGCRVLVLDEPTSSLTRQDIEHLFERIRFWKSQGIAVMYISHFLEEIEEIADHCTVMCDGRVVRSAPLSDWSQAEMVRCMVGRDVEDLYPRSEREPGETVLSVSGFGAELELHRGEILGIAGLIGAGRTELLESVFGLREVREGSVQVKDLTGTAPPSRRWQQGAGFVSEDRKQEGLALGLSVTDNIVLSRLPGWSSPKRRKHLADRWLEPLRIKCASSDVKVQSLSGGNQQKAAVARLLHHGADIWLLDEPTRGIDVGAKAVLYDLLDQQTRGEGDSPPCAVLMVSSYLPELLGVCDRIAVMRRGKVVEIRSREEWTEHSLMEVAVQ